MLGNRYVRSLARRTSEAVSGARNGHLSYHLLVAVLRVRGQTEFDDDLSIYDDPVMSVWVVGHRNTAASVRTVRANSLPRGVRRVQLSVATAESDPLRRLHVPKRVYRHEPARSRGKEEPPRERDIAGRWRTSKVPVAGTATVTFS